jgi:cation transport regulator
LALAGDKERKTDLWASDGLSLIHSGGEENMPYKTLGDLSDNVTNVLPKHAQEIYRAAFNNAWDEYKDPDERRGHESREEAAHKVAWAAVKKEYEKVDDEWMRKKS